MYSLMVFVLISLGNADKLDRLYLPPPNAKFAGGRPGDIVAPRLKSGQNQDKTLVNIPTGLSTNRILTDKDAFTAFPIINELSVPTTDDILIQSNPIFQTENIYYGGNDGRIKDNEPSEEYNNSSLAKDVTNVNTINQNVLPKGISSESNEFKIIKSNDIIPSKNNYFNSPSSNTNINIEKIRNNYQPFPLNQSSSDNKKPELANLRETQAGSKKNLINDHIYPNVEKLTNVGQYPSKIQAEANRNAVIHNFENTIAPESYAFSFDTSNGIHSDENGTTVGGTRSQGSYSYIGDDGKLYNVTYIAGENGFQPRGEHLPTSPPIPDAIQKVLEQIAANERNGIFDDGSYDENKYGHKNYENKETRTMNGKKTILKPTKYFTATMKPHDYDPKSNSKGLNQFKETINFEPKDNVTKAPLQNNDYKESSTLSYDYGSLPILLPSSQESNKNKIMREHVPTNAPSNLNFINSQTEFIQQTNEYQEGYQYFPPSNTLILPSTFPSSSPLSSNNGVSTSKPFANEVIPQGYKTENEDQLSTSRISNSGISNLKKSHNITQNLEVVNFDKIKGGFVKNPTNYLHYHIENMLPTSQYTLNTDKSSEFGQKIYTTTPIYSQSPFYEQNYDLKLNGNSNDTYKIAYPTTSRPDLGNPGKDTDERSRFVNQSKLGDDIKPAEALDEFVAKYKPTFGEQGTDRPHSTDITISDYKSDTKYKPILFPGHYRYPPLETNGGEDFSGPKQPQRYDSETGYHY